LIGFDFCAPAGVAHDAPCGGEARLVGAMGLRPFFLAKKKGPKKTLPQSPGGCAHTPRGLALCFG